MGIDGTSSELGPLAQALQRRRSAASNQDQQAHAMGKYMAPPLPPNSPNRKPLGDCNTAAKRALGPNGRRPHELFIPRPGATDLQDRSSAGGAMQHRNCPTSDQRTSASGCEQRPGVKGFEHRHEYRDKRTSDATDSEYQPSSAAGIETRTNTTGFEKRPSAMGNSGFRGNGSILDQRPSATAGYDPRPNAMGFEQRPNMTGFEPRLRSAASAEQRPNALADLGQRPAPAISLDTRPNAGATSEQSPRQGGLDPHPNDAGSTDKRPGVAAASDPHHNGSAGIQLRPNSITAVNPRPSTTSDFELNPNASVGSQSTFSAAEGSDPLPLLSARSLRTPKPTNAQPQYANPAAHPPQQQAQQASYQAGLQRPSTSNLERSSVGPLTAAAVNLASSQRRPNAGSAGTLRASTGALPPTSKKTTEPTSSISGAKGTTTTVATRARSSADSISWMDICAEGRAEADRKRGLTLPNDHKSELKQWLYHDIMQRQGHPLHVQKNIGFQYTQPGVSLPPQLVR
ncbi:hypothetical protein Vretimale_7585 [Volvox reticuliferus]|uniref:Uncharacterized protein n=1 Tax=Volvox reticuliferus TaxID=1737510 RepID=A0A8J4LMV6_9CHLO|nr:hypothetical protein Vretifemale_7645 [Volvox reticuliferus]GIM02727.1 hypothetical protein Vretimale_7585 [Volvox reticuliferus]